ncbi:hypothetical protein H2198_000804 [Neophaeococcomyces mojaviensis]|uniref:Uncharacterized protein n=1 Tax=Neophaeococcomyces mojaviensis TaxID=3383035 RepID=A0ACC3AJH5_9EURO|nr:hypothetical protein H2198_000804 [Knufia sp. JES_112]
MPIKVSDEGWVRVPPPKVTRRAKPVDPVDILRGPLAYITGRPEFKESAKKQNQSIKQLMLEAASIPAPPPPPEEPVIEEKPARSHRSRKRVPSAAASVVSLAKAPTEIYEVADEEIPRPDLHLDEIQSRRSASPAASRHSRAAPSTRSRRHVSNSLPVYQEDHDHDQRHSRHASRSKYQSSRSVYHDDHDDDHRHYHRSNRSERSYRDRDDYYSRPHYRYDYPPHPAPAVQPIVIYSTPPPAAGCGAHHHNCNTYHSHSCHAAPRPMIETPAPPPEPIFMAPAALAAPSPPPSVISSTSSRTDRSGTSRTMSHKWYTATQPLKL